MPVVARREIARPGAASVALPEVIVDAGTAAVERFLEFFAAAIANDRTRAAYEQAAAQFLAWCGARGLALRAIARSTWRRTSGRTGVGADGEAAPRGHPDALRLARRLLALL